MFALLLSLLIMVGGGGVAAVILLLVVGCCLLAFGRWAMGIAGGTCQAKVGRAAGTTRSRQRVAQR